MSADCSLQVVESQHRSGDLILANDNRATDDSSVEPEYEKVAIYATSDGPEHVARQKASGVWTSKMGKGVDMEHTLDDLEGEFFGKVVKIMRRKCQDGKRVLE